MSSISYEPPSSEGRSYFSCIHCGATHTTAESREQCCAHQCEHCGERHRESGDALDCCTTRCQNCGIRYHDEDDAFDCCRYRCDECGSTYESSRERDRCCGDVTDETDPVRSETGAMHLIKLDRSSGRRPRLISVEQEISHGLDRISELASRGDWYGDGVTVKDDGSLAEDGAEVEYSKMNLYEQHDAEAFSEKIRAIRILRNDGEIRTGARAGTHIHVSAHDLDGRRVTPKALASVYGAFCHCEGAIYRIAAAGWVRHRREESETDYAQVLQKHQGMKVKHVMTLQSPHERYYGVSYARILNAVGACHCGAIRVGDWQDCECDYWRDATWEWRVFNSTTRPETMHAWILLAVGLTDYAIKNDCVNLPIHGYDSTASMESLKEQVDFILNFKFSEAERKVMKSVIAMSPGLAHTV